MRLSMAHSHPPFPTFLRSIRLERSQVDAWNTYPFSLEIVMGLEELALDPRVTILVGENGTGKSTLLEAISVAWGLNAEGGSRNMHFSTRQSHSSLHEKLTLVKGTERPNDAFFFRSESFYNLASELERLDEGGGGPKLTNRYGGKSLHHQSHGEAFISVFLNRFQGGGLYVIDEPEAALSPLHQLSVLARIMDLTDQGSQFLIATHAPILLLCPGALILELKDGVLRPTSYSETDHFRLTRDILNNPEQFVRKIAKHENP